MPLTTRCGRCGRLFPIHAQQLRAFGARVTCPQCGHRFNGRAALIDEPTLDRGTPDGPTRLGIRSQPRPAATPVSRPVPAAQAPRPAPAPEPEPVTLPAPGPKPRAGLGARLAGGLVALILILALIGQLAWWNRAALVVNPQSRGVAAALCAQLGCDLPLVTIPDAFEVLDPQLGEDTERDAMTFALKIKNTADLPQPAPLLDLELLDPQGEPAAARRFSPEEYADWDGEALIAPGETISVSLALAGTRTGTSGFKVRLP